jgi:methylenetetrahydrofolate reductase (NADPH)
VDRFAQWMEAVRQRGLHKKVYILAGVAPIKSAGAARYMKTKVPGMDVPDEVVDRMASAAKGEAKKVGIDLCVDIINQVRQIEGVAGVHIMAIEWEEAVAEIVEKAELLPRPHISS